jgi:DNA-binding transcriptional regulator YiaG
MQKEIWKPVKNYEGLYEVSNFGRMRSLPKEWMAGWNSVTRSHKGFLLKPGKGRDGYLSVSLSKEGKIKHHSVHRIVLQSFIGESVLDCNHKDGDKENNYLNNLEYCSTSENIKHAYRTGLKSNKGEKGSAAKLNNAIIRNIRENKFNLTKAELAACFEVSISNIKMIISRKTWVNVS